MATYRFTQIPKKHDLKASARKTDVHIYMN